MAEAQTTRRLAAILAADVVGYSRMVGEDEQGTIDALREVLQDHFRPIIAGHKGRIVKLMGDGALVEFSSVVDAVDAAVEFQRAMAIRNASADKPITLRIGVNLGDIVIAGADILGDGVNIAARLEARAPAGGVLVSDVAWSQVAGKIDAGFADGGEIQLKNITRLVRVWRWDGGGKEGTNARSPARHEEQEIHFCTAPDGAGIAYASVGSGPPLVRAPHWMTHLEYEWHNPFTRHFIEELATGHRLIRFDQRANGLSDRDVETVSLDAFVSDLETVVDAVGLERFPIVALSQGCAISIAYAVRHPERVSRLILFGGFARGPFKRGAAEKERAEALITLMKHGWGQDNPAFRQVFTSAFMPDATQEQMQWFNELQRRSASPDNAVRLRNAVCEFEVSALCAQVKVPTLVLHCRGDAVAPFDEGRRMAAMIPGARFVPLESNNHIVLEHEPAWQRLRQEIRDFLKAGA
jgi:class 3 adenylate cyclase/pimeloyl-ACP methyl ester carboxylesterase